MEELLIKIKDEKESSFIKDLLKKLKIQFETVDENTTPSAAEIKKSVIDGQAAYKNGKKDEFEKIDRKDLWK
jgi:RNase H-fold protein (predicted Holliday junction resolvase)